MALFKRKDKENKKGSENAIGKIIYGFLLFMPLLSIGARCLYVILNKNAYQSYSSNQIQNVSKVVSNDFLIPNNKYSINSMSLTSTGGSQTTPTFTYTEINIDWSIFGAPNTHNYNGFRFQSGPNAVSNKFIYLYENGVQVFENHTSNLSYFNDRLPLIFTMESYDGGTTGWYNAIDTSLLTISISKLDNVFEYSIEQTQQSNIYNWAKQTGTYTVLHNTTTGLGITNEFIPMLMAYWLIVSVIYFLFDIALILIWAVHKKIHELSEAI